MPAQNAHPTPNSRPIPAAPTPRTSRRGFSPVFNPMQKSMLKGLVGLAILSIGLVAVVGLAQRSQDGRSRASLDNIDFSLVNDTITSLSPGQTFTVDVVVDNTNSLSLAAVDLTFTATNATLQSVTMGPLFDSVSGNSGSPTNLTGNELYNVPAENRYAVGAACDECELVGTNGDDPDLANCNTADPVACYPKPTSGVLATATFVVDAGATGNVTVGLDTTTTEVAAIDSSGSATGANELGDVVAFSATVNTGGGGPTACDADINSDGLINGGDYVQLLTHVPTNNPASDINGDGLVNGGDYIVLIQFVGQTCTQ